MGQTVPPFAPGKLGLSVCPTGSTREHDEVPVGIRYVSHALSPRLLRGLEEDGDLRSAQASYGGVDVVDIHAELDAVTERGPQRLPMQRRRRPELSQAELGLAQLERDERGLPLRGKAVRLLTTEQLRIKRERTLQSLDG